MRTISLLATAALGINLLVITTISAFAIPGRTVRYLAQSTGAPAATEETALTAETTAPETPADTQTSVETSPNTQAAVTEEPSTTENLQTQEQTGPCGKIRSNEQTVNAPLTTVSDTCLGATVTAGTIGFDYIPHSFLFPARDTSGSPQDSFSNDNPNTPETDVSPGMNDILTIHDYRNAGGFTVTITANSFESAEGKIPLRNLFVATTYPGDTYLGNLDPTLRGPENKGIEYAAESKGPQDIAASAATDGDLNLPGTYTASLGRNADDASVPVELMNTKTGHIGRFSEALNFLLRIPADQPAGSYQVKFTVDLVTK